MIGSVAVSAVRTLYSTGSAFLGEHYIGVDWNGCVLGDHDHTYE